MNTAKARNAYQKSEAQAQIHPVKLIHLLYERVLLHLELAEQAVIAHEIKARGENLSKAIAIVSELNASIEVADNSDAAEFLRGLYGAILLELPKVAISLDVEIIRKAHRYLSRLLEIWQETAMVEAGFNECQHDTPPPEEEHHYGNTGGSGRAVSPEYSAGGLKKFKVLDAAACHLHGVSVSI
ncbi:MAG: flagellar export chaperone FliS [Desulfobulbaceae bacterium]|nr:flagellar export chaperone FliS [Desulfobulbaceae bacterium]